MIAIHQMSGPFAAEWILYCRMHDIPFRVVDCFSSDIVEQLSGCTVLMWHWEHHDFRAQLFARQLIASVEQLGLSVFPSSATSWHYDDKVGQKYLLEAVGAPLVPAHVFYEKEIALEWIDETDFPKVWKLRAGAGSRNVRLVRSRREARNVVRRAFGRGWSFDRFDVLKERIWQMRRDRSLRALVKVPRSLWWSVFPNERTRNAATERNYVYFQDFIPDNDHDIRVIVIGDRAFAIKRMVRTGDFRASGSGVIIHDKEEIPEVCIRMAFDLTKAIESQCCAFDFVRHGHEWKIVEISYAFTLSVYVDCPGYWRPDMTWVPGQFHPEHFMIEDALASASASPAR